MGVLYHGHAKICLAKLIAKVGVRSYMLESGSDLLVDDFFGDGRRSRRAVQEVGERLPQEKKKSRQAVTCRVEKKIALLMCPCCVESWRSDHNKFNPRDEDGL
jgi:hypothetical protein